MPVFETKNQKTLLVISLFSIAASCGRYQTEDAYQQPEDRSSLDDSGSSLTSPTVSRVISASEALDLPIIARSGESISCAPGVELILQQAGDSAIEVSNVANVRIEGCVIRDVKSRYPGYQIPMGDNGVSVFGSTNVVISGVRIHNISGQGGIVIRDSTTVRVNGVVIDGYANMGIAIHNGSRDVAVTDSHVKNASARGSSSMLYGVTISGRPGGTFPRGVSIVRTLCENNPYWDCFDAHGGEMLSFSGNRAVNSAKCFDLNASSSNGSKLKGVRIASNYCEGTSTPLGPRSQGIAVMGEPGAEVEDVTIIGNTIVRPSTRPNSSTMQNRGGIHVASARNATISGNTVTSSRHFGIVLESNVYPFKIERNVVRDVFATGFFLGPRVFNGTVSLNQVHKVVSKDRPSENETRFGFMVSASPGEMSLTASTKNVACVAERSVQAGKWPGFDLIGLDACVRQSK